MGPRVDVLTGWSADPTSWEQEHRRGRVPDAMPYGLDRLAAFGYSVQHRPALTGRLAPPAARVLRGLGHRWDWWGSSGRGRERDVDLCWDERSGIPTALLRRPGSPAVVTGVIWLTDADQPLHPPFRTLARTGLGRCAAVWALSSAQLPILRDDFGIRGRRCFRLPFGIDAEFWSPAAVSTTPQPAGAGVVVGVGNDRHRDHPGLVAAVAPLAAAGTARLHLVSLEPVDVPPELGRRTGRLDHVGLREVYATADVVAVALRPNVHVSGMTTVLEAQAMGRPVVCTRTPGMTDYVRDGVTGVLVPPGDVAGMTAAIGALLADPERAAAMGRAGREFVLAEATTTTQARHLAAILTAAGV